MTQRSSGETVQEILMTLVSRACLSEGEKRARSAFGCQSAGVQTLTCLHAGAHKHANAQNAHLRPASAYAVRGKWEGMWD